MQQKVNQCFYCQIIYLSYLSKFIEKEIGLEQFQSQFPAAQIGCLKWLVVSKENFNVDPNKTEKQSQSVIFKRLCSAFFSRTQTEIIEPQSQIPRNPLIKSICCIFRSVCGSFILSLWVMHKSMYRSSDFSFANVLLIHSRTTSLTLPKK